MSLLTLLTLLPVVGGILIVSWSVNRRWMNKVRNLAANGVLLGGCILCVNRYGVPILYGVVRAAVQEPSTPGSRPAAPEGAGLRAGSVRAGPVVCRIYQSGEMRITAAITNLSDVPVALDAARLEIWIATSKSNILHPDFLKAPVTPRTARIFAAEPKHIQVLDFGASIPRSEVPNLSKSCSMEYRAEGSQDFVSFSEVGSIDPSWTKIANLFQSRWIGFTSQGH